MVATEIKTETRYEVLNNIDLNKLTCLGILPVHLLDWKFYYEKYLEERENHCTTVAVQYICDEYGIGESTVYKIVKYMGG